MCAEIANTANQRALLEKENTILIQNLNDCTADLEQERAANFKAKTAKVRHGTTARPS